MDKFDIIKSYLLDEGFAETEEAAIGMMVSMSESWKEEILEGYKGKHGQSDKEYADSRSQGGKMVSGDSKMSGAEYTHGRRVKAANPGMQPDVGGKTKPKSQGKMDKGTRADLEYRKANLKKEELELDENRRAARSAGGYKDDSKKQTDPSKDGFTGISGSIKEIMRQNKEIEAKKKKMSEGVRDEDPEKGTAERKARLEKKRGMKLDDHPQYKKEEVDPEKSKKTTRKKLPHMGTGNPHYDAKSAGISRVKDFKFTPVKEEVVTEKKKDDTYLETDMKKRQENNEKARKDMEKMGTKMKNPHFEEVQQVDEIAPLLAAVPAMLGKAAAVGAKVGAVGAKAGAAAAKGAAKVGAKSGMKAKLKLKMKDMAKDKAMDMVRSAPSNAADAASDLNPLDSLKNSHEPQGEQIHEISAETALAASKGRDKQAMMLRGPENTEKRAELRAKASQNYDRAVKKRKEGYVKNTASPQGPVRKMTAESINDIIALRAEMLNEEKE